MRQHGKQYRILLRGELRRGFESEFTGMSIESRDGRTTLRGSLDQSQLHGILQRIQDFNLQIIEVEELPERASAEQYEEKNE